MATYKNLLANTPDVSRAESENDYINRLIYQPRSERYQGQDTNTFGGAFANLAQIINLYRNARDKKKYQDWNDREKMGTYNPTVSYGGAVADAQANDELKNITATDNIMRAGMNTGLYDNQGNPVQLQDTGVSVSYQPSDSFGSLLYNNPQVTDTQQVVAPMDTKGLGSMEDTNRIMQSPVTASYSYGDLIAPMGNSDRQSPSVIQPQVAQPNTQVTTPKVAATGSPAPVNQNPTVENPGQGGEQVQPLEEIPFVSYNTAVQANMTPYEQAEQALPYSKYLDDAYNYQNYENWAMENGITDPNMIRYKYQHEVLPFVTQAHHDKLVNAYNVLSNPTSSEDDKNQAWITMQYELENPFMKQEYLQKQEDRELENEIKRHAMERADSEYVFEDTPAEFSYDGEDGEGKTWVKNNNSVDLHKLSKGARGGLNRLGQIMNELYPGEVLYVTSGADGKHDDPGHANGTTIDIDNKEVFSDPKKRHAFIAKCREYGIDIFDEYENDSPHKTGTHLHANLSKYNNGAPHPVGRKLSPEAKLNATLARERMALALMGGGRSGSSYGGGGTYGGRTYSSRASAAGNLLGKQPSMEEIESALANISNANSINDVTQADMSTAGKAYAPLALQELSNIDPSVPQDQAVIQASRNLMYKLNAMPNGAGVFGYSMNKDKLARLVSVAMSDAVYAITGNSMKGSYYRNNINNALNLYNKQTDEANGNTQGLRQDVWNTLYNSNQANQGKGKDFQMPVLVDLSSNQKMSNAWNNLGDFLERQLFRNNADERGKMPFGS